MRIAVTGATGFVGGAIGRALEGAGHDVVALGRSADAPEWARTYGRWDLASGDPAPAGLGECEAVIHAAAHVSPWGADEPFVATTVRGTARLLDVVDRAARLVVIGSSSVYDPRGDGRPMREADGPVAPSRYLNAYARSKAAQEGVVRARRPDAIVLRPRAVWGPGDRTLLPRVMARARAGVLPLPGGGTRPASMTYVDSLVAAVLAAIERTGVTGAVNVADATPVVPADLLTELFERLYRPVRIVPVPALAAGAAAAVVERAWRVARIPVGPPLSRYAVAAFTQPVVLDLGRLQEELGVAPDEDVDIGLARTAAWLLATDGLVAGD